jgi:hypothetical protein
MRHCFALSIQLICYLLDPKNDSKILTKREKKFRQTFVKMEGFSFVTPVIDLNRPNTGKEDDNVIYLFVVYLRTNERMISE